MKAVILAGGLGTRMREETEYRPKPMVDFLGQPLVFHIMSHLSRHGIEEFVIAAGYKAQVVRDYFANFSKQFLPLTTHSRGEGLILSREAPNWTITVVDTGLDAKTSDRLISLRDFVDSEEFLVTYGDGLTDADITAELEFHRSHGKTATVMTTRPKSRFGILEIENDGKVARFREKPTMDDWVSSGFFIFSQTIFEKLEPNSMFEESLIPQLARSGELFAFKHDGFWEPVDTSRELESLRVRAENGELPWLQTNPPKGAP